MNTKISDAAILDRYDTGLLGAFGGGDIAWWHDYIRSELERAHEFYQDQADNLHPQPAALNEVGGEGLESRVNALLKEWDETAGRSHYATGVQAQCADELRDVITAWQAALAATGKQQGGEVQGDAYWLPELPGLFARDPQIGVALYSGEQMQDYARATLAARHPVGREPVCRIIQNDAGQVGIEFCGGKNMMDHVGATLYTAPPAQGIDPSPIAARKLGELAEQGYVTNGVAIFNPATGQRGLVDNLGFVGWMGAQGANDRESCSNCDNGIAINSNFRTEEACRHCQTSQLTKVAEVVKNTAGQVYIEWIGGMVVDHAGSSLYKFNGSKE